MWRYRTFRWHLDMIISSRLSLCETLKQYLDWRISTVVCVAVSLIMKIVSFFLLRTEFEWIYFFNLNPNNNETSFSRDLILLAFSGWFQLQCGGDSSSDTASTHTEQPLKAVQTEIAAVLLCAAHTLSSASPLLHSSQPPIDKKHRYMRCSFKRREMCF